jgi:hypothetical protein
MQQILKLYNRAIELQIDVDFNDEDEIILTDNEDDATPMQEQQKPLSSTICKEEIDLQNILQQNARVMKEFRYLSKVAT